MRPLAPEDKQTPLPFFKHTDGETKYPNRSVREVNPNNEPYGAFTGRCSKCQSSDLWDDATAYGCNNCGSVFNN